MVSLTCMDGVSRWSAGSRDTIAVALREHQALWRMSSEERQEAYINSTFLCLDIQAMQNVWLQNSLKLAMGRPVLAGFDNAELAGQVAEMAVFKNPVLLKRFIMMDFDGCEPFGPASFLSGFWSGVGCGGFVHVFRQF